MWEGPSTNPRPCRANVSNPSPLAGDPELRREWFCRFFSGFDRSGTAHQKMILKPRAGPAKLAASEPRNRFPRDITLPRAPRRNINLQVRRPERRHVQRCQGWTWQTLVVVGLGVIRESGLEVLQNVFFDLRPPLRGGGASGGLEPFRIYKHWGFTTVSQNAIAGDRPLSTSADKGQNGCN